MKATKNQYRLVMLLFAAFLAASCGSYYKIADPVTGNIYYSEQVKREGSAAMFKDARSGSEVTIQNSEISEVSKKDFEEGLKTPASNVKASPTAPASAPAEVKTPTAPEPSSAPAGEAK